MSKVKNAAVVSSSKVNLDAAWQTLLAVVGRKIFGSCFREWTPLDEHKKPKEKVLVPGVVDGNRLCEFQKIHKPSEKIEFCNLLNKVMSNPSANLASFVKEEITNKEGKKAKIWQLVEFAWKEQGIKAIYYKPTFSWSGKDKAGNVIFGLGEDWSKLETLWKKHRDEFKVSEEYGQTSWGEPILSPINVLEQINKGLKLGFDLPKPIERGRAKKAKIIQADLPAGFLEELANNFPG